MQHFIVLISLTILSVMICFLLLWVPDQLTEIAVYDHQRTSDCTIANFETLKRSAIVYTWVNGTEECYNQRRTSAGLSKGGTSRDKDIGELQYSIRSLIKFVPWLEGPIYIVTPGQIPNWLDMNNSRVKVIDQDDLFPDKSALPSFNTNAIEQFLYRIPGITDIFIHMNDDYLFVKPTSPRMLFSCDGGPRFLIEINHIRHVRGTYANAWLASVRNTVELTDKIYGGQHVYNFLKHAPFVYSKKAFASIHSKFGKELQDTVQHKVRDYRDLNIPLLHHIFVAEEGGRTLNIPFEFNPLSECNFWKLIVLRDDKIADLNTTFNSLIAGEGQEILVALNDDYTSNATARFVQDFYAKFLPDRPPHELPLNATNRAPPSNRMQGTCEVIPGLLTFPSDDFVAKFQQEKKENVDVPVKVRSNTFVIRVVGLSLGIFFVAVMISCLPLYSDQLQFFEEIGLVNLKYNRHKE